MDQRSANMGIIRGILCVLALLLSAGAVLGQGVSVAPSRIVLDGRTRSATVFVSNRSDQAETYRVSLSYWIMEQDGTLVRADSLAEDSADWAGHVLRYSPRRVVIPAGGSQTLRLLVRRPPGVDVEDREFRAHLSVRSVPTVPRLKEVEDQAPPREDNTILARLQASVETLVPVVVRFGRPEASLDLAGVAIGPDPGSGEPAVQFTINRRGNRSVYGDLVVKHFAPDGSATCLYSARGIAIYAVNDHRTFSIGPRKGQRVDLSQGKVSIEFQETADGGGGDLHLRQEFQAGQLSMR